MITNRKNQLGLLIWVSWICNYQVTENVILLLPSYFSVSNFFSFPQMALLDICGSSAACLSFSEDKHPHVIAMPCN